MNTNAEFKKHQVKHLFLLVGENALPNYVAARLLLENNGTVYLVHTTKTKEPTNLLKKQLKVSEINLNVELVPLGSAEADGYTIKQKIKDKIQLKGKATLQGRVGLNYTGGTKAMAVHAYQAVLELNLTEPVFSYLDSRTLQMCIDDQEQNKTLTIPVALALSPTPKLETILALHNLSWQKDNQPTSKSQIPNVAIKFAELHLNPDIARQWRKWCDEAFKPLKLGGRWLEDKAFPNPPHLKLSLILPTKERIEVPEDIKTILREQLQCISDTELSLKIIKDNAKFKHLSEVCQWLDGGWLEDYVLGQIEEISENHPKYHISDSKMSLHIQDPNNSWRKTDQFEFDVAFLRGYQLFGISCTTSSNHKFL